MLIIGKLGVGYMGSAHYFHNNSENFKRSEILNSLLLKKDNGHTFP